jgi:hypothetical protein
MTTRTMDPQKTPCELAAEAIVRDLRSLIAMHFSEQNVRSQMSQQTFTAVMAGYFEQKTIHDWCTDFGIDTPEGDRPRT